MIVITAAMIWRLMTDVDVEGNWLIAISVSAIFSVLEQDLW